MTVQQLGSVQETRDLAQRIAGVAGAGDLILLSGGIGSGKTVFVKAFADAIGFQEVVVSPTFVLHAVYTSGRLAISHVDLYRLDHAQEIEAVGFADYFDESVTLVEWADKYRDFQPPYLAIRLDLGPREDDRIATIRCVGGDWSGRLQVALTGVAL